MRIAFMGTPEFSVPVLSELIAAGHEVAAVYTRAPKPAGRGQKLKSSPVHQFAEGCGLDVRTPKNFKELSERKAFAHLDLDVAIVVAYGVILPQEVLDAPRLGCLNLHASLLPRWRGAAPIQRAIMAGDTVTGVQVMQMEAGLDTGPVLLSETTPIGVEDTAASLHDRLRDIAAQLGPRALAALERGSLTPTAQSETGVMYANKISAKEARIDWSRTAEEVDYHIRGLSPFPGAWFEHDDVRVKALMSRRSSGVGSPGEILHADEVITIACGEGAVDLLRLQRAGKRVQASSEFLRGVPLKAGQKLT